MRLYSLYGVTLLVFLTMGCSVTYRAAMEPIPPSLQVDKFQGQGEAISIKNEAREGVVPIGKTLPMEGEEYVVGEPDIRHYSTDLKQVTDVTASFLAEELSKRGFSVWGDASKSITLNVTGIYLAYFNPYLSSFYHCLIEMEYTTSDGRNKTVRGSHLSDYYARACNGAIMRGVVDLLNDQELIDFLTSKER
ncbi:MAG TPA: hypothetical protein VMV04_02015 [Thermodesulfobacteriota bacterium]|nr:hypothetical protein [Thermodesulfobacteriota bacterium]